MKKKIEVLRKALEIYSPSGKEQEVSKYLAGEMSKLGFKTKIDGVGNVIGTVGNGKETLLIAGHIDTVPGFIKVKVQDDNIHGRGSVDAKSPFLASMFAVSRLKEINRKIILVGAVQEEGNSAGALNILDKYNPDYILICEPSSWQGIILGYKGSIRIIYEIKKEMKHNAFKDSNAFEEAFYFFEKLKNFVNEFNKGKSIFNSLDVRIENISSNNDSFFQNVEMKLRFKTPINFKPEILKNLINENKGNAKIEFISEEKPIKAGKNNNLVRAFLQAIRNNKGVPKFKLKTGTADMNILGNHFNVPILAYGPGDSSLDHTPNEHISIKEFEKSIKVLEEVFRLL